MRGLGTIINALAIVIGGVLNNLSLVGNILIFVWHQSGVAKNHQGGKPAAVPSGCSGADGDFMNRNLTRSVIV